MQNKIYVGNLPYSADEASLEAAFAPAGAIISVFVAKDKYSGRSKGFGFVEFETDEAALKAIELWNEKDMDGRPLRVNIARPKVER